MASDTPGVASFGGDVESASAGARRRRSPPVGDPAATVAAIRQHGEIDELIRWAQTTISGEAEAALLAELRRRVLARRVGPVPGAQSRSMRLVLADVSGVGAALIGVLGTVLGVGAGIGGQLLLERTRAAREEARLREERERAVRASASIMLQDFHRAKARLDQLSHGDWWPIEQEMEFLVALEDRRRLAACLDPGEFTILVRAEDEFNNWQQQWVSQPNRPPQINKAALRPATDRLDQAMTILMRLPGRGLPPAEG